MPASTTRGAFPYPLAADAPPNVHLDIKALADRAAAVGALDSQGTHAARPAAATSNQGTYYYETDTGHLYRSTGSLWLQVDAFLDSITTTFPSSPFTGQKVASQRAVGVSGFTNWEFIYIGSLGDAYKWVFEGGCAQSIYNTANYTFVADGSGPDIATDPVFTAPWAGYYQVHWGGSINLPAASSLGAVTTSGALQLLLGAGPTVAFTSPSLIQPLNAAGQTLFFARSDEVLMTASQVMRLGATASSASGSSNYTLSGMFLFVTPVRVSP